METTVKLQDRNLRVELSSGAERALASRSTPLLAEMELYFSCLIRKRVRFHESAEDKGTAVNDQLRVHFHPVMSRACSMEEADGAPPPLTDFPIAKPDAYTPHWLRIDYRNGEWEGEFGFN